MLNWLGAYGPALVGWALAILGLLSQLAAVLNLGWLGRVDAWLVTAIRWLAGNWGYAASVIQLVELYRTAGPDAALARLAALAGSPKSGGS